MSLEIGDVVCWKGYNVHFGEIINFTTNLDPVVQKLYKMKRSDNSQHWIYTFQRKVVRRNDVWVLPFDKSVIQNPTDSYTAITNAHIV